MELSGSNIKNILIISQKKAFLVFRETETQKKLIMFQETELFIFQETFYFLGSNLVSSKNLKNPI